MRRAGTIRRRKVGASYHRFEEQPGNMKQRRAKQHVGRSIDREAGKGAAPAALKTPAMNCVSRAVVKKTITLWPLTVLGGNPNETRKARPTWCKPATQRAVGDRSGQGPVQPQT